MRTSMKGEWPYKYIWFFINYYILDATLPCHFLPDVITEQNWAKSFTLSTIGEYIISCFFSVFHYVLLVSDPKILC
jgi:hypothetical protein